MFFKLIYCLCVVVLFDASGTRRWWFMKWGFSSGSKLHNSKYVRTNTYLLNPISAKPPLRKEISTKPHIY